MRVVEIIMDYTRPREIKIDSIFIKAVTVDEPEKTYKGFYGNEAYRPSAYLVSNRI